MKTRQILVIGMACLGLAACQHNQEKPELPVEADTLSNLPEDVDMTLPTDHDKNNNNMHVASALYKAGSLNQTRHLYKHMATENHRGSQAHYEALSGLLNAALSSPMTRENRELIDETINALARTSHEQDAEARRVILHGLATKLQEMQENNQSMKTRLERVNTLSSEPQSTKQQTVARVVRDKDTSKDREIARLYQRISDLEGELEAQQIRIGRKDEVIQKLRDLALGN